MDYRYLEHTADAEFIAYGRTLDEAFVNAARAMCALVVDPEKVKPAAVREIDIMADSLENLLYDWLSELLYLMDVELLVFSRFEVAIAPDGQQRLTGRAYGEKAGPQHEIALDIKAVTYHDLRVEKRNNTYEAQVLLDI